MKIGRLLILCTGMMSSYAHAEVLELSNVQAIVCESSMNHSLRNQPHSRTKVYYHGAKIKEFRDDQQGVLLKCLIAKDKAVRENRVVRFDTQTLEFSVSGGSSQASCEQ